MSVRAYVDDRYMRNYVESKMSTINTMIVGIITGIDNEKCLYDIQPILMEKDPSGELITRAIMVRCPLSFQKCGSFFMRIPYEIGDMVYVGLNQESIDESLRGSSVVENRIGGVARFRMIDGVVIGGIMNYLETTTSDNIEDFIIQNRLNNDKIVMKKSGGIDIVTVLDVNITNGGNTNVQTSGDVMVDCSNATVTAGNATVNAETNINGNTTINGNLMVNGGGSISGGMTAGSVSTKKGISLDDHTHEYSPGGNPPTQTGGAQ